MIWTTDSFQEEFEKLKNNIDDIRVIPSLFRNQLDKLNEIVAHWKVCPACKLGFFCCQYDTTFDEVCLNIVYNYNNHICDNDYRILFQIPNNLKILK